MANGLMQFLAPLWRLLGLEPAPAPLSTIDLKHLGVRFWEEVFNQGSAGVIDELFAPDFQLHDMTYKPAEVLDSLDVIKGILSGWRVNLPEAQASIQEQLIAEGDRLITRFVINVPRAATDPEASAPMSFYGVTISRVVNGRFQESWLYWESLRASQDIPTPENTWRWPPWWW